MKHIPHFMITCVKKWACTENISIPKSLLCDRHQQRTFLYPPSSWWLCLETDIQFEESKNNQTISRMMTSWMMEFPSNISSAQILRRQTTYSTKVLGTPISSSPWVEFFAQPTSDSIFHASRVSVFLYHIRDIRLSNPGTVEINLID